MPDTLHVLLGAHGDLCAMLPWMKAEAERLGKPVKVLVAREYVPLFDGVSYARAVEWPGTFVQLTAALRFLKTDLPQLPVKVLQPISRMEERTFPSFVHEMWYQAGALAEFGELPLVFDRRDPKREAALVRKVRKGSKPMLLVAAEGRSSPFRWSRQLLEWIRAEFGDTHQIVDLSKVKAHRFYDLLGLYDQAAALVSIDTGHAHLSRASKVPTLVLARDYPQLWDGVPFERRFAFYCRYGQWRSRKQEMKRALQTTLRGGRTLDEDVHDMDPIQVKTRGYNPAYLHGTCTWREHLCHDWRTRIKINDMPLRLPDKFRDFSHEDMRLFFHPYRLMASCTIARQTKKKQARCITVFGELKRDRKGWHLVNVRQPKYGLNNWRGTEKNWVFFSHENRLYAIYGIMDQQQITLELSPSGKVRAIHKTPAPRWAYGEIRGGTFPLLHPSGHRLRFFHSRTEERGAIKFRYHLGALLMENKPPFRVVKVIKHPLLSGNEEWMPGCHHWKPNVVFPCGAKSHHDGYSVFIGVNDAACRFVKLPHNIL
jgi:hypothetical protein